MPGEWPDQMRSDDADKSDRSGKGDSGVHPQMPAGLAIPVRIKGSWDNPRILPDLEKALELHLAGEVDKLEDQAEEELRRAVGKELGVDVEEGQKIEDVLEDALKDEALKGLRSLFD